ncbi:MAG TPA: hypothetical protein VFC09_03515 [Candidatus Dormibacteraeota bacterium]|nr:hypothetical protein [Candidatus Dormibacteraeota bacterium]
MRRPPSPAQVELAMTLVALAAAVAAALQAVIALVLRPHPVHPSWAPGAAAGALAFAALCSLLVGRLRFGPAQQRRVSVLRWLTLAIALAAGGVALGAGLTA